MGTVLEVFVRTVVGMVMILKVACRVCVFVPGLGHGKAMNQNALVVFHINSFLKLYG